MTHISDEAQDALVDWLRDLTDDALDLFTALERFKTCLNRLEVQKEDIEAGSLHWARSSHKARNIASKAAGPEPPEEQTRCRCTHCLIADFHQLHGMVVEDGKGGQA